MFKRLCMVCARVPWRLLFFLLTIGTTWLAGGWMYAVCVIAFFGAHEMGHYLMARHYGMEVTLPMFLPMPNILGTMGAFIGIRSPFMNRRELFDVGVAGPLSGLVVAIPLSVVGIWLTSPSEVPLHGIFLGKSLFWGFLERIIHGSDSGQLVLSVIHPVAFAGWIGLFATALNLIPFGQLDGGHAVYAAIGRTSHRIFLGTLVLGIIAMIQYRMFAYFILFALVIFMGGMYHPPTVDDSFGLDRKRQYIFWVIVILFMICFVPMPFSIR